MACSGGCTVAAETLPNLVALSKPSVLVVGTYSFTDSPRFQFRGTGFVVGNGLQVITNAHVLPTDLSANSGRRLAVQVLAADGTWRMRETALVSTDVSRDLALLKFDGPAVPALRLADSDARAQEGAAIALIGFPLGGVLGFKHVTHRGIVAAKTDIFSPAPGAGSLQERAVSQLRKGVFEVLQLDAIAYPGNSGGPVFDIDTGEVIGVVNMVLIKGTRESALSSPTGISYAVPVSHVWRMLKPALNCVADC